MPLFDFRCRSCHHEFESLVRSQDTPECPTCHGHDLEKLMSSFAVSSPERRSAVAKAQVAKAAAIGRKETIAMDEEINHHRMEDH